MRWILEFALGAAFWLGLFFYLSEIAQVQPGDRPPPFAFGIAFAIAFGRVMIFLQTPGRRVVPFTVCHLLAAITGISLGLIWFPPPAFSG